MTLAALGPWRTSATQIGVFGGVLIKRVDHSPRYTAGSLNNIQTRTLARACLEPLTTPAGLGSLVLPVRRYIGARFVQVNMLIDMVDPRQGDEMMVLPVRGTLPGELDLVGTFEMIDLADRLPVR
jgi:hypothetical protein